MVETVSELTREVILLHRGGGQKLGLTGKLWIAGKNGRTSKVMVSWPLNGILVFTALTGREQGNPKGPWRLSEEDVKMFCAELNLVPRDPKPTRSKPTHRTKVKPDPKQLSLTET